MASFKFQNPYHEPRTNGLSRGREIFHDNAPGKEVKVKVNNKKLASLVSRMVVDVGEIYRETTEWAFSLFGGT